MNARDLQNEINRMYNTWTGPPRAYFEIDLPAGVTVTDINDQMVQPFIRIVYFTYALAYEAEESDGGAYESALCGELLRRFTEPLKQEEIEDRIVTLIWRRDVRYTCDQIYEDNYETNEEVRTSRVRHQVSLRCYCPRMQTSIKAEGALPELLHLTVPLI